MILTVTLNPAVDVTYTVDRLDVHETHRVRSVHARAGGKGVNAARVLHQLGHDVVATGLLAGPSGAQARADLDRLGLPHAFHDLSDGETRRCVTVVDTDATVFNEPGPHVDDASWDGFVSTFDELAAEASLVVMSGSLPPGVRVDAYASLCRRTSLPCIVDTSGEALMHAAETATVLTPNAAELAAVTGADDPRTGAGMLLERGAGAVAVSLGADGMMVVSDEGCWQARPPARLEGNPTGAGDAATAALAATHGQPWPERVGEAIRWSAAAVPAAYAGEVDAATLVRLQDTAVRGEPCR